MHLFLDEPVPQMAEAAVAARLEQDDVAGAQFAGEQVVRRVDVDASGAITGLIIEPEGEGGPRWVRIPLEGLTVRRDGNDHDLATTMTLEQLKAMPAWMP